jgi:DNA-binding IclR family transcriptional regulator
VTAALSVTGTTQKLPPGARDEVMQRLIEAANRVSYRLGHQGTLAY